MYFYDGPSNGATTGGKHRLEDKKQRTIASMIKSEQNYERSTEKRKHDKSNEKGEPMKKARDFL